jgi:Lipocalin-like domain
VNATAALVGAWSLRRFVFTDGKGGEHFPLGETPRGFVLITPDQHLSLCFMAEGRAPFAENAILDGGEAERANAAASYVSFGGPCRIEGDEVVVEVVAAFHPNWAGSTQRRRFALDGDRLTLSTLAPIDIGGRRLMGRAELIRANAP